MLVSNEWKDYKILKTSNGMKLESWKDINLLRPDPVITWDLGDFSNYKINAIYYRSNTGGGHWENKMSTPESWVVNYKDIKFLIKEMGFKHTGLFPEQANNWDFIMDRIKNSNRKIKVLNLFAYTGAASVVSLYAGAEVVHVDSSRGMVDWAKENVNASGLGDKPIRYLVDDCIKFVNREIRRGNKYDIILMDPPSFGRGSNGEVWDIEKDLYPLVDACKELLSDDPVLFLINSYTTGLSKTVLENVLELTVNKVHKGNIVSDEIGLPMENSNLILPCGIFARWEKREYKKDN